MMVSVSGGDDPGIQHITCQHARTRMGTPCRIEPASCMTWVRTLPQIAGSALHVKRIHLPTLPPIVLAISEANAHGRAHCRMVSYAASGVRRRPR